MPGPNGARHVRVRPPGRLADLLVGVPERLEPQRTDLLWLQPVQRVGRPRDAIGRHHPLHGRRRRRPRLERVEVELGGPDDPPPRAVDRQRLVLDHGLGPGYEAPQTPSARSTGGVPTRRRPRPAGRGRVTSTRYRSRNRRCCENSGLVRARRHAGATAERHRPLAPLKYARVRGSLVAGELVKAIHPSLLPGANRSDGLAVPTPSPVAWPARAFGQPCSTGRGARRRGWREEA